MPSNSQLTYMSLARTENLFQMLETLALFSNVQPHLQPHLQYILSEEESLRMCFLNVFQGRQSVDRLSHLLLRNAQVVQALQIEPKFGCRPEEMRESKSCITCDSPPPVQDFRDPIGGYFELPSEFSSAHVEFLQLLS